MFASDAWKGVPWRNVDESNLDVEDPGVPIIWSRFFRPCFETPQPGAVAGENFG